MKMMERFGWPGLIAVCLVGMVSPTGVLAQNSTQGFAKDGRLLAQMRRTPGAIAGAKMGHPVVAADAAADGVEHVTLGQSVVPLYGPWRFSVGDSPIDPVTKQPLWAEPGFDDSHWETVNLKPKDGSYDPTFGTSGFVPGWTSLGHPGYSGFAWYRLKVAVAGTGKLALAGPANVDDGFQVFADGQLIGSFGEFTRAHPLVYNTKPTFFSLPSVADTAGAADSVVKPGATAQGTGETRTIALRVWMEPSDLFLGQDTGGLHGPPMLGEAGAIAAGYQLNRLALVRSQAVNLILSLLFLLLAILAFSLSLFDRSDKVYYWIAGAYLAAMARAIVVSVMNLGEAISTVPGNLLLDGLIGPLVLALWVMVWWVWFKLERPRWLPAAVVVLTILYSVGDILGEEIFFGLVPHAVAPWFHLLSAGVRLGFLGLLVLIVVLGVRQQGREGWIALPAVVLLGVSQFELELVALHVRIAFFPFEVAVSLGTIASFLLMIALFVLLLRRGLLSVKLQREQALDIQQAVEVQQVILPEALAAYGSLTIETIYRAARQVGGDFFQMIPNEADGSLLVVVGDVTGKGLQAGMLVALLVGAIRTAAEVRLDPLFVLEALNRRLIGRKSAQATCLAFSVAADGAVTLANAGHIPPYLNGKRVAMEGALPLGMIAGAEFSVMKFQMQPQDKLLVISDGILEATNKEGDLFGFERLETMLAGGAGVNALADAAEAFGQEDDISLVAVTRG